MEPNPRPNSPDALDAELVRLLNARAAAVRAADTAPDARLAADSAALARVAAANPGPMPAPALAAIYREILAAGHDLVRPARVAYLGPPATFTHMAARSRFGAGAAYEPCETIPDVFQAVDKGAVDYGVVPIENSTDGAVTPTLDECIHTRLKICAELYLPIAQHLMGRVPLDRIRRLYSHPQVFGQVRAWLRDHLPGVEHVPVSSTSRAAELAAREDDCAAVASRLAAELWQLPILAENIHDLGSNTTRFLVIGRAYGPPTGRDKTSLIFTVKHQVGALHSALAPFRDFELNLTKIESRPSKTKVWEYFFFVDIEGHEQEPRVRQALERLAEHCVLLTVLGSYPLADLP